MSAVGDALEPAVPSGPRGTVVIDSARESEREGVTLVMDAPSPSIADESTQDAPATEVDPESAVEVSTEPKTRQDSPPASVATLSEVAWTLPRDAGERVRLEGSREVSTIAEPGLRVATIGWRWSKGSALRPSRTVVVTAVADIVHGGGAILRDEGRPLRRESELSAAEELSLGEEKTLDEGTAPVATFAPTPTRPADDALAKRRVDVCLVGSAYTPDGKERVARCDVRFCFGASGAGFDHTVRVFGDRKWGSLVGELLPGQPEPFESIPLTWERTIGGARHPDNPVGMRIDAAVGTRIPNLEWPGQPLVGPRQRVQPACFAPLAADWPLRALAEDEDLRAQHAPTRQQLDRALGDEPFVIEGANPSMRRIEGTLPGVRARCFVLRSGRLEETQLCLDTVTFVGDDASIELTWRGVFSTADAQASDVEAVAVLAEELESPLSLIEAEERARSLCGSRG